MEFRNAGNFKFLFVLDTCRTHIHIKFLKINLNQGFIIEFRAKGQSEHSKNLVPLSKNHVFSFSLFWTHERYLYIRNFMNAFQLQICHRLKIKKKMWDHFKNIVLSAQYRKLLNTGRYLVLLEALTAHIYTKFIDESQLQIFHSIQIWMQVNHFKYVNLFAK